MAQLEIPLEIDSLDSVRSFIEKQAGAEKAEEVVNKLKGLIDQVKDLPDDEKKAYLEEFGGKLKQVKEAVQEKIAEQVQFAITVNIIVQLVVFALLLILVLWFCVFIGRKLYRMMTEKERKQAEKKKLKDERKSKPSKQKDGKDSDKSKKKKN
ncbi:uncharacterized protein LOC132256808 isoform X1 [Phlebotomus argentipes]|uniref:uncharacterized protein LOC132256808 isoform X1 n=1 Tax=Phlebotomus argentipes TaxID=94469 RepID=UPI0028934539|nr:uncharacterized protein LOC132256808 isoform X1 [Phlebotomus argentipes]